MWHGSRSAMENGAERPRFFAFTMLSSEIDCGITRTASDTLEIHQRQLNDFRFFVLDEFNLLFDFLHMPSPGIAKKFHLPHLSQMRATPSRLSWALLSESPEKWQSLRVELGSRMMQ